MKKQKINFSSTDILKDWTGGVSYRHLFHIEIFGFKIEFWKRIGS